MSDSNGSDGTELSMGEQLVILEDKINAIERNILTQTSNHFQIQEMVSHFSFNDCRNLAHNIITKSDVAQFRQRLRNYNLLSHAYDDIRTPLRCDNGNQVGLAQFSTLRWTYFQAFQLIIDILDASEVKAILKVMHAKKSWDLEDAWQNQTNSEGEVEEVIDEEQNRDGNRNVEVEEVIDEEQNGDGNHNAEVEEVIDEEQNEDNEEKTHNSVDSPPSLYCHQSMDDSSGMTACKDEDTVESKKEDKSLQKKKPVKKVIHYPSLPCGYSNTNPYRHVHELSDSDDDKPTRGYKRSRACSMSDTSSGNEKGDSKKKKSSR